VFLRDRHYASKEHLCVISAYLCALCG